MNLNYVAGGILIAIAIALQFANLYAEALRPAIERHPALRIVLNRLFQLGAGFALLTFGIDILR